MFFTQGSVFKIRKVKYLKFVEIRYENRNAILHTCFAIYFIKYIKYYNKIKIALLKQLENVQNYNYGLKHDINFLFKNMERVLQNLKFSLYRYFKREL